MVGFALMGILSYHLGLIGVNVNYLHIFLPPAVIALGYFAGFLKLRKKNPGQTL